MARRGGEEGGKKPASPLRLRDSVTAANSRGRHIKTVEGPSPPSASRLPLRSDAVAPVSSRWSGLSHGTGLTHPLCPQKRGLEGRLLHAPQPPVF